MSAVGLKRKEGRISAADFAVAGLGTVVVRTLLHCREVDVMSRGKGVTRSETPPGTGLCDLSARETSFAVLNRISEGTRNKTCRREMQSISRTQQKQAERHAESDCKKCHAALKDWRPSWLLEAGTGVAPGERERSTVKQEGTRSQAGQYYRAQRVLAPVGSP